MSYCPQTHQYIHLGMTRQQVLSACGEPNHRAKSQEVAKIKIPVQQLIFNNAGTPDAFYGTFWSIPTGVTTGAQLTIDIVNNKVYAIRINGNDNNEASLCGGAPISIGDPASKVSNSCGNPSVRNQSFMYQNLPGDIHPEIWTYITNPYQAPMELTFVNDSLETIE
ncbi:MAG: DUF2845 domain-containing protein [Legionellaceae bacterium]|nr:DUF2845 domain-containing protein [Legionellaceae bacterium]